MKKEDFFFILDETTKKTFLDLELDDDMKRRVESVRDDLKKEWDNDISFYHDNPKRTTLDHQYLSFLAVFSGLK